MSDENICAGDDGACTLPARYARYRMQDDVWVESGRYCWIHNAKLAGMPVPTEPERKLLRQEEIDAIWQRGGATATEEVLVGHILALHSLLTEIGMDIAQSVLESGGSPPDAFPLDHARITVVSIERRLTRLREETK